ncbi:Uncharacterized protein AC504_3599 [Pseudomonas syringae pv. maculicola]|nr:Uncharacterized protein AC514_5255 [Pseudomonas savastanoi pv. phaseolicola]KPB51066.1 Uncharacterized protein AC512_4054 [Pseudomonas savastanoi pv. phaseolicola]KPB65666.1 Uncharacterized protein AC508_3128 [Pseudomonas amygdali pv. mellea]KPB85633.1 Uncharacterized protein AC504_3599 [Pseudomonas syringae pv. maculicola]
MAFYRVKNPGSRLPWRLMAQVLSVAAGQQGNPVPFLILLQVENS